MRVGGHRAGSRSCFVTVSREDRDRLKEHRWSIHPTGYAIRRDWIGEKRVTLYLHREVMGLKYGDPEVVDHLSGEKLDCRRENLRILDEPGWNGQNVRRSGGSSRFRGVAASGKKWRARVSHKGESFELGSFDREIDAAIAAELKRQEILPFAEPDPALVKVMGEKVRLLLPRRESIQPIAA